MIIRIAEEGQYRLSDEAQVRINELDDALEQSLSGARYDAVEKVLHLTPPTRGDYKAFLSTAQGYGTVGVKKGKPFIKVVSGTIPVDTIHYKPRKR